ncbi:MAG: AGE family epimerase/isomerase [Gaiellaceae bacterium]
MHPIGRRVARGLLRSAGGGRRRGLQLRVWDLRSAWLSRGIDAVAGVEYPCVDSPEYDAAYARDHVLERVLPFWERHSVDREHGGFLTFLTRAGEPYDTMKSPTLQARMVYAFAIAHELDARPDRLELARHGVDFLLGPGRDREHGGWLDLLDRQGRPLDQDKPLFTQAYVLFGLAHYARVTGDRRLRDQLLEAYDLVELHAWDPVYGGYYARCERDWSTKNDCKTICVQLDFMKTTHVLYELTGEQRFADRTIELADLVATRMRDPRRGVTLERFTRDWRYDPAPSATASSWGTT